MQEINISELHPHPRNSEFFDDMTGEKWSEFIESIKSRGVIEPIIITPDMVIVSGHQRVRACKELGIETIAYIIRTYNNDDEILQDLIETNIRQRADVGGSAKKVGLRIKELERIYGIHNGNQLSNNCKAEIKQTELAEKLGMSIQTLQNYKKLTEMIPELEELVDTGIVAPTTALAVVKRMSPDEQEEFVASMDVTKKITNKQVKEYIEENEKLKKQLSRPTPVEVKVVDNTDYEALEKLEKRISEANDDYCRLSDQYKEKVLELQEVRSKLQEMEDQSPEVQYKKKICDSCILFNARVSAFIKEVGGYVWLADKINEMSPTEQHGYMLSIQRVKEWAEALEFNINKQKGEQLV